MTNVKQAAEDLLYLLDEIDSTAKRNRRDIPEDLVKIFTDLSYHGKKILKRLVVEYKQQHQDSARLRVRGLIIQSNYLCCILNIGKTISIISWGLLTATMVKTY
jgi:hypothetical protein